MSRLGARSIAPSSHGFTLVELLVVIAIIGVLAALLLPAIQAARGAARRIHCQSNMKNIALALVNYHDTHGLFPPGFIGQARRTEAWGWPVFVLPQLEEQGLYDALGVKDRRLADLFRAAGNRSNAPEIKLVQTSLPIFRCPSDTTPKLLPNEGQAQNDRDRHFRGRNTPPGFKPPTSNYMGLKGFWDNRCEWTGTRSHQDRCDSNGILFGNSRVRQRHITDGTTKTFLIGERDLRCKAGTWIGSRNPPGAGMFGSYMLIARSSLKINHPSTGHHNTCTEGFSSSHSGGAYFAMCDGSVHFIVDYIDFDNGPNELRPSGSYRQLETEWTDPDTGATRDLGLFQRLGIRNDGLAIEDVF